MKLGFRGKLFAVSLFLILLAMTASGVYVEAELRNLLDARMQGELAAVARSTREAVLVSSSQDAASMDALADRVGEASGRRVTIIDQTGRVTGDSHLSLQEVAGVENHAGRPEILAAAREDLGVARRYSSTLAADMIYASVRFAGPRGSGFVRVATPLAEVYGAAARLRALLLIAGVVGLVAAGLMSLVASHLLARTLERLVERARTVSKSGEGRIAISGSDELGRLAGFFNRMAAELERSVAALASERTTLTTVLEGMSEGLIALDAEGRVTMINGAAMDLLNIWKPPVGLRLAEATRVSALDELVAESHEKPASTSLSLSDGSTTRHLIARARPLESTGGAVVVMLDVTELRRLETIRKDFVANVSHELRTPVTVIRATSEMLLGGALSEPARAEQFVDAMHRNAERLSDIITDLLQLSRIEAGQVGLEARRVRLADAVERAVQAVQQPVDERGQSIELQVDPSVHALADARALDQVLLNLLINATRYTPEAGHLIVRALVDDRGPRLEVEDNGPGIAPEHRERIFERFYRVDAGRSREVGGTGLGLAIVKHLVESMGGQVGVSSVEPSGSCFWLVLPAEPGEAAAAGAASGQGPEVEAEDDSEAVAGEDDPDDAQQLRLPSV